MKTPEDSIAQLSRLVEGLAAQLTAKFGPEGLLSPGAPDPYGHEVEGRSLKRWFKEIWPQLHAPDGPVLSQQAVEGLGRERHKDLCDFQQLLEVEAERLRRARQRLHSERSLPAEQLEKARLALARAETRIAGMRIRQEQLRAAADRQERECRELEEWLGGLTPRGMKGYCDYTGRPVSPGEIQSNTRRLESLRKAAPLNRQEAKELSRDLAKAIELRLQAAERIKPLQKARDRAEAILALQAADLEDQIQQLWQKRRDIDPLQKAYSRSQALVRLHDQVLCKASEILRPMLMEPEPRPAGPPMEAVRQCQDLAGAAGERARRLAAIIGRQVERLEAATTYLAEINTRARQVNQELQGLESQLPGLLLPLLQPSGQVESKHARAAARIATLLARLNDLTPQALEAHADLKRLRKTLRIGIARAKRWQEAWREAIKEERAQAAQAEALMEEVRLAARERKDQARDLARRMQPLLAALAPIRAVELVPLLASMVGRVARLRFESLELKIAGHELGDRLPRPAAPAQAKAPASLKPFSAALRRLSGKQVDLEKLYALGAAAQRWHDMAAGSLMDEIRRPVEQAALKLSAKLESVSSQKEKLEKLRARRDSQVLRLYRALERERQCKSQTLCQLDQAQLLLNQQTGMLRRYKNGIQKARDKQLAIKEQLRRERDTAEQLQRELSSTATSYEEKLSRSAREYEECLAASSEQYERRISESAAQFAMELEEVTRQADTLAGRLEHSQKLAQALKGKSLERHRLYRKSRHAIEWMDYWKDRAQEQEALLGQTRSELEQARKEYEEARVSLNEISRERDSLSAQLAGERAARARQALDLLGGKALSVELAASQSEAGRWAALARQLSLALAVSGESHEKQSSELRRQVDQLGSEAAQLRKKLAAVAQVMERAGQAAPEGAHPATLAVRVSSLEPEQVYSALDKLGRARGRLQKFGRSTLGHMAVIAALTGGLVLVPPGTSSKATRTDAPLTTRFAAVNQLSNGLGEAPLYDLQAEAARVLEPMAQGSLELNLLPLRSQRRELPQASVRGLKRLAKESGVPHESILVAARAVYTGQDLIESATLRSLADRARRIALAQPHIRKELGHSFKQFDVSLNRALEGQGKYQEALFEERLYREYRHLGFSAAESLGALTANQIAAERLQKLPLPKAYLGKAAPIDKIEGMDLKTFMARVTPYMEEKLGLFLKQRKLEYAGDVKQYVKNLAFDMYCAAKKFQVPVTLLMSIAHQETWYANVLGDSNLSASPFQIYRPTKALIRHSMAKLGFTAPPKGIQLERHLTMATYMAAFHLRELMYEAQVQKGKQKKVNLNQVLYRYNGSLRYIAQVAMRRGELAQFIKG